MVIRISISQVEYICVELAREIFDYDEPIPYIGSRYPYILEQCLTSPFQQFGGKDLYPSLEEKASALFYFLIKNHPLQNGNKRIACISMLLFLVLNGMWLEMKPDDLYELSVFVAKSSSDIKEQVMKLVTQTIIGKSEKYVASK